MGLSLASRMQYMRTFSRRPPLDRTMIRSSSSSSDHRFVALEAGRLNVRVRECMCVFACMCAYVGVCGRVVRAKGA